MSKMNTLSLYKNNDSMSDEQVTPEYVMENVWIVGSPSEVESKIRKLYSQVGGFGVLLAMGHEWIPEDKWKKSMTLLAEKILPNLSDLK